MDVDLPFPFDSAKANKHQKDERNKLLVQWFYEEMGNNSRARCRKCMKYQTFSATGNLTNPLSHLKSCQGEDEDTLFDYMWRATKFSGETADNAVASKSSNQAQKSMRLWLELVVMEQIALNKVESDYLRAVASGTKPVSSIHLRDVLLELVELVEDVIEEELPEKFALALDGWTKRGVHNVAVYAIYNKSVFTMVKTGDKRNKVEETEVVERLLCCSTMTGVDTVLNDMGEEVLRETAINQNAVTHREYILNTLAQNYGKNEDNIVAVIAENASVMRALARELQAPMIGCCSHKLNLAIEKMVKEEPDIQDLLEALNGVMKAASSCNNRAKLASISPPHLVMHNRTRWSGKYHIVKRYNALKPYLPAISGSMDARPLRDALDRLAEAKELIELWENRFENFEFFANATQLEKLPFHKGRKALDAAMNLNDLPLFRALKEDFGSTHLARDGHLVESKDFESGLYKLQRYQDGKDDSGPLTEPEKRALRKLLKPGQEALAPVGNQSDDDSRPEGAALLDSPVRGGPRLFADAYDRYMPAMFILGSTATVSKARNLIPDNRASMAPVLVEALLFLSENKDLWGQTLVNKAIEQNKGRNAESRAAKKRADVNVWEATTINEFNEH